MTDLEKQEQLTRNIRDSIRQLVDNYRINTNTYWDHQHVCTFELLGKDTYKRKKECKKYLKNHPIVIPTNYPKEYNIEDDKCEFCPMLNYIALDDEGRIMYITRTFPDEILDMYEKQQYNL